MYKKYPQKGRLQSFQGSGISIRRFIMRISFLYIFILAGSIQLFATHPGKSQGLDEIQVTIEMKNEKLEQVFKKIEEQTELKFVFGHYLVANNPHVSLPKAERSVKETLELAFSGTQLRYEQINGNVLVYRTEALNRQDILKWGEVLSMQDTVRFRVTGTVTDESGEPLSWVNITVKSKAKGVETDLDGKYEISVSGNDTLVFSYIGFKTQEFFIDRSRILDVVLQEDIKLMSEVVVTGIVDRRAESFTGATTRVTGEELRRAGNQNILQSLANLDPSFQIEENIAMGSDPNSLPDIRLRGQTSIPDLTGEFSGNPNQPLFILDGFETTLQNVYDLDINRVQSITVLKDASAKAIYGAKAGNGVVVIETLQPKQGELRVNYTGSLNLEVPDLTGYNLMNAKEKLQWEKDHNMWHSNIEDINNFRQQVYNNLYQDVYHRGVDTDWLSQPLQTGINQDHSLYFDGGDEAMRYSANFSYNGVTGAMKESDRKTYAGNVTLSYRVNNLRFRNYIQLSQNRAHNSPYGQFSDYVSLNPYWTPYNDNGNLQQVVGFYPADVSESGWKLTFNPLYNASLNIIDESEYTHITDNFYLEWDINNNFRFTGSLGYSHQSNSSDYFLPPTHTEFLNFTKENGLIDYKGRWTRTDGESRALQSNLGLSYNFTQGKHFLFGNATLNLDDRVTTSNTHVAEGFGSDDVWDISMGNYYERASAPFGSDNHTRSIGILGLINYSFDDKYLLDASYRTSASSIYGLNDRWGQFWSLGVGWNLHHEDFIKNLGLFQRFKLRGSFGYTGTQNADAYMTLATYDYGDIVYDGAKGAVLEGLPNPDLNWQKNLDYNIGLDLVFLDDAISVTADVYKTVTTNLLVDLTSPPSFGFSTYKTNLGKAVNRGYELAVRYRIFTNSRSKSYLNISVTAAHVQNELDEISDAFANYNEEQGEAVDNTNQLYRKPVARYYEGQSLSAIWAMNSLGIDPATGRELFMDRDGNPTYEWNANQLIIAGDREPIVKGTMGVNMGYKGFTLSIIGSYRIGGQLYNSTLVERVENIDGKSNLDRRIMDAWYEPGDVAIYQQPQVVTGTVGSVIYTKPTTRFVQDNHELYISTINLGYDWQNRKVLDALGLERLRFTAYANELLRISSIDIERGTNYPFARNFSFTVQATF